MVKRTLCQHFMRFLFSHVGLCLFLILYASVMAQVYMVFEEPKETTRIELVRMEKNALAYDLEVIKNETIALKKKQHDAFQAMEEESERNPDTDIKQIREYYRKNMLYSDENVRARLKFKLDEYHKNLSRIFYSYKSFKGSVTKDVNTRGWTFPSALIFSVSALTLIGYGHIKPFNELSRLMTIVFCLIGVPLMLMFLANIGRAMARIIRFSYSRICCFPCRKKRRETAAARGMVDTHEDNQGNVSTVVNFGEPEPPPEPLTVLKDPMEPVPLTLTMGIVIGYILFGATVYFFWEDWKLVTSIYCAYTTLTTIGFGDYVPGFTSINSAEGVWKLIFGSVYIVTGLAVVSMGFDLMIEEVMTKLGNAAKSVGLKKDEDGDQLRKLRRIRPQ